MKKNDLVDGRKKYTCKVVTCLYYLARCGKIFMKIKRRLEHEFETKKKMFLLTFRHWLATYFVIRYGVPYMTYDIFAMYLSHYHRFRVKGHEDYKGHSLRTVSSFVRREFLLVLHHIALLTILLPVTLVRNGRQVRFGWWWWRRRWESFSADSRKSQFVFCFFLSSGPRCVFSSL